MSWERDRVRWVVESRGGRTTSVAVLSDRTYTFAQTEPRPTMERIRASEARRHLPRLLDRIADDKISTITRHGRPPARLVLLIA